MSQARSSNGFCRLLTGLGTSPARPARFQRDSWPQYKACGFQGLQRKNPATERTVPRAATLESSPTRESTQVMLLPQETGQLKNPRTQAVLFLAVWHLPCCGCISTSSFSTTGHGTASSATHDHMMRKSINGGLGSHVVHSKICLDPVVLLHYV